MDLFPGIRPPASDRSERSERSFRPPGAPPPSEHFAAVLSLALQRGGPDGPQYARPVGVTGPGSWRRLAGGADGAAGTGAGGSGRPVLWYGCPGQVVLTFDDNTKKVRCVFSFVWAVLSCCTCSALEILSRPAAWVHFASPAWQNLLDLGNARVYTTQFVVA